MSTDYQQTLTNLTSALADGLSTASEMAWDAYEAGRSGRVNEAIGTLLPVAEQLETYTALCKTILALHRSRKDGAS